MYSQIHCWPINWKFSAQLNTSLAGHYQAFIYLFIFLESKEEMISIGWYLHIVGLGRGQVGGCAAWIMDCSLSCFVCTCCCAFWMNIEAGSGLLWLWRLILIFTWLHCSLCTGCSACVRFRFYNWIVIFKKFKFFFLNWQNRNFVQYVMSLP